MRYLTTLIAAFFLSISNTISAQDVTKIKVTGLPNGTTLGVADIAIATISPTNSLTKAIGYNYRITHNKLGVIVLDNSHTLSFSKVYSM